jgi:DNA primase
LGKAVDREDIREEIRERTDIVSLVSEYVTLRKAGQRFVGLCPFHTDSNPSFSVHPQKRLWYCFGCQEGGDIFAFVQKIEGLTFPEAAERLAQRAGVRWERTPQDRQRASERELLFRANELAKGYFSDQLLRSPVGERALSYLAGRGLGQEAIERFGLGFARESWDGLLQFLRRKGVREDVAARAGLLAPREGGGHYDRFRNRVMFPILDVSGRTIGFGGRTLGDDPAKYINSPETPIFQKSRSVYGINLAARKIAEAGYAVVVEGYTDVISLHMAGVENVVATLGTAFTEAHVRLLNRYAGTLTLCFDADSAGMAAALRNASAFERAEADVRVIALPAGTDPDEFVRTQGKEAFLAAAQAAVSLTEFRLGSIAQRFDWSTQDGRLAAVREMVPALAEIPDRLRRQRFIRWAAERLAGGDLSGVEALEQALVLELRRRSRGGNRGAERKRAADRGFIAETLGAGRAAAPSGVLQAERALIALILAEPSLAGQVREGLGATPWPSAAAQEIAEALAQADPHAPTAAVLDRLGSQEAQRLAAELSVADLDLASERGLVSEYLTRIKDHHDKLQKLAALDAVVVPAVERGEMGSDDPRFQEWTTLRRYFHGAQRRAR